VGRMHVVELGFKLEPQLHFLLVVLGVLHVVLFQFESHLPFIRLFSLQLFAVLLQGILILLEHLFVVGLLLEFSLVVAVQLVKGVFVLFGNFTDEHAVVCAAAVLEQDGEHLPDIRNDRVLLFSVLQTLLNQLVETHRIHEERAVNAVYKVVRNSGVGKHESVNAIA